MGNLLNNVGLKPTREEDEEYIREFINENYEWYKPSEDKVVACDAFSGSSFIIDSTVPWRDNPTKNNEFYMKRYKKDYVVEIFLISPMWSLRFKNKGSELTNGIFDFINTSCGFDCSNSQITSLEGAPCEVGGLFDCSNCPNLASNKYFPTLLAALNHSQSPLLKIPSYDLYVNSEANYHKWARSHCDWHYFFEHNGYIIYKPIEGAARDEE